MCYNVDHLEQCPVFRNPNGLEEGAQFELADGEHYIIEEYQGPYEEADQTQYETVYIQPVESPQQGTFVNSFKLFKSNGLDILGEETAEVYTISEEIEDQYAEEDQPDDDDDDQQMAIVEEIVDHHQDGKTTPTVKNKYFISKMYFTNNDFRLSKKKNFRLKLSKL